MKAVLERPRRTLLPRSRMNHNWHVEQVMVEGRPVGNMWTIVHGFAGELATLEYQGDRLTIIRGEFDWHGLEVFYDITRNDVAITIAKLEADYDRFVG